MEYTAQNFDALLGLAGFSDQLLKNHFTLYQGYVTNTNKLNATFTQMLADGKAGTPEWNELKRRYGWEFNGMRLHELYFGNMTKEKTAMSMGLAKKLTEDFGSAEAWEKDLRATGAMRGIGWTMLVYDVVGKKLSNIWINEHDAGYLAGSVPLLVMDVFEHAFMLDYGIKRADYIEAFMKAIDWAAVSTRFENV
jgi:Fe-Mn family superoxide dismutase